MAAQLRAAPVSHRHEICVHPRQLRKGLVRKGRMQSRWRNVRGSQHAAEVADVLDEPVRALEPGEGVGEVAVLRVGAHLAGARAARQGFGLVLGLGLE